jgi:uncharacterized RDD family membrane protein YckC
MKCPKCAYLGFEDVDRCRNCGYDFSLTASPAGPELSMRSNTETLNPIEDLVLIDAATAPPPAIPMSDARPELESFESERRDPRRPTATDLPLFGPPAGADDEPLITRVSPPRPPLSVRRATPDAVRLRAEPSRPQRGELPLDLGGPAAVPTASYTPGARAANDVWPEPRPDRPETAAVSTRLIAVAIDLLILLAVDVTVVYFTMQICNISWEEASLLPRGPLLFFLLVQNGGYLVAFTAGGQTLGKMATGIRVVGTESAGELDLGRAFMRTLLWFVLAIPAGLGFLTLLNRDHRGLHDRFAGTRVVRASA